MSRALSRVLTAGLLAAGLSMSTNSVANAQGDGLMEIYGEGVHQYFAGDLMAAEQLFSRVINSGSQDPRAYYFRGLVRERQGGGGEFDFEQGARLEAEGRLSVPVGLSLIRVQGATRGKIEKARRDARVLFKQQRALMMEAQQNMAPATVVPSTPNAGPPTPSDTGAADPFAEGLRSPETTEDAEQPSTPEVDAATDPFADDGAAAAGDATTTEPETTTEDPFGGDAGTEADPFGGDAGGEADPFGGDAGGDAGMDDPFGGDAAGGGLDDPFGN